jgi:ryanodine receptor 2
MIAESTEYSLHYSRRTAMSYRPAPIDTTGVILPSDLLELKERLAENAHDNWARERMAQGWTHGPRRDDDRKLHPCLVPYDDLPEDEKVHDRNAAIETLKAVLALGYRIEKA